MHTAVFDGERRRTADLRLGRVLEVADQGLRFCRSARSVRAQDLSAGSDYVQFVEPQRLRELRDAHADRQAPLIEIAGFEPGKCAVDQRVVPTQGFTEQR